VKKQKGFVGFFWGSLNEIHCAKKIPSKLKFNDLVKKKTSKTVNFSDEPKEVFVEPRPKVKEKNLLFFLIW
jgi:hypothetical protein